MMAMTSGYNPAIKRRAAAWSREWIHAAMSSFIKLLRLIPDSVTIFFQPVTKRGIPAY
jgi:hypothetical protein